MQIIKADNGYVIADGGTTRIASSLEEVFDYMLGHYEGRSPEPGVPDRFGAVIILRCKCFRLNLEGVERVQGNQACSNCSERLAILV